VGAGGWRVERSTGSATTFHARPLPEVVRRAVHVLDVDRPALVLGSTQRGDVVDRDACGAAGVEVVRRRSGGGAVLLAPREVVWVDVEVPRGDDLWDDDVGRAVWWLGERWAAAVGGDVHRGGLERGRWGDLVCFAGLGPGEVTTAAGAKVVGISQRRTRAGARFQCAVPLRWDPAALASLLALDGAERYALSADLAAAVAPVASAPDEVVDAFLDRLP
jgi:lipoate-protein ligase A